MNPFDKYLGFDPYAEIAQNQQISRSPAAEQILRSITGQAPKSVADKLVESVKEVTKVTRPLPGMEAPEPTPSKALIPEDIFKELQARELESYKQQKEGIREYEKELEDLKGVEINPLMAAIAGASDALTGSNKLQELMGMKAMQEKSYKEGLGNLQKMRKDLSDTEIKQLVSQFVSQYQPGAGQIPTETTTIERETKPAPAPKGGGVNIDEKVLKTKESQAVQSMIKFKNTLDQYQSELEKIGFQFSGEEADKIETIYADLKIKYKEAANLGALTGPDINLLMEAIKPSTGVYGGFRELGAKMGMSGGVEGTKKGINKLRESLKNDYNVAVDTLQTTFGRTPLIQQYRDKFGKKIYDISPKPKTPSAISKQANKLMQMLHFAPQDKTPKAMSFEEWKKQKKGK